MTLIKAVYDNGGETFDRYTIYFEGIEIFGQGSNENVYGCLSLSEEPGSPQGCCQHSTGQLGDHNGETITFGLLPKVVRDKVLEMYPSALAGPTHGYSTTHEDIGGSIDNDEVEVYIGGSIDKVSKEAMYEITGEEV